MAPPLPQPVVEMLAGRSMRIHHYLWHTARGRWERWPEDVREVFREMRWDPPRSALDRDGRVILDNDSGEDFLYMHREMIADVNAKLDEVGDPSYVRVEGWGEIPRPGDPEDPVPPPWDTGDPDFDEQLVRVKSDQFFQEQMVPQERRFTDPDFLKTVTLGELGARIEFGVHNSMHMRWAERIDEFRPNPDPHDPTAIPTRWDDPSYDWLGDFYSSHVNGTFWRLHGWVDARIDDWMAANDVEDYEWKGTWVGPEEHHPHRLAASVPAEAVESLERLAAAVGSAGGGASPFDDVRMS